MTNNQSRLRHLFNLHTQGSLLPDERRELMQYIADPAHRHELDQLISEAWDQEPAMESLEGQAADRIVHNILIARPGNVWTAVYRVAAVFIALILTGSVAYYFNERPAFNDVAMANGIPKGSNEAKALVLPDGSTVLLKEGSELIVPENFDAAATRSVTLEGEGYFDIVHDPTKPFVVNTGVLQTRVLGTAFVITAYKDDANITVAVSRGRVEVADHEHVIGTLIKNQQITFDKQRRVSAQQAIRSDSTMAWTKQDMHFDDVTLAEAVSQLSNRYGVKVQFSNEQASLCKFTATFNDGESFIKVLEVICAFNHANYRQKSPGEFVIEGPGC